MTGSTVLQARALDTIRRLTHEGVPPSYIELADALGLGVSSVHRLLHALRDRGHIELLPHRARSIRIIGEIEGLERRSDDELRALRGRIDTILKGRAQ